MAPRERRENLLFSMAIGKVELMYQCFPKHSYMGTARMKQDKENEKEVKQKRVSIERSKVGMKKEVPIPSYSSGLLFCQGHYSQRSGASSEWQ